LQLTFVSRRTGRRSNLFGASGSQTVSELACYVTV